MALVGKQGQSTIARRLAAHLEALETVMQECEAYRDLTMLTQNRRFASGFPWTTRPARTTLCTRFARSWREPCEDVQGYVDLPIPLPWLRVHDELRRRAKTHPTMRIGEIEHFAMTKCAMPPQDVRLLLRLLHELGVLLYYDEPMLRLTVFLDPQWLIDRFSRVIRSWLGEPSQHLHRRREELGEYTEFGAFLNTAVASVPARGDSGPRDGRCRGSGNSADDKACPHLQVR